MEELAIIGLSAKGNHSLTVKFIKYGANDFITKPFISELLFCRINQNLKTVENFEKLRQITQIDHLTNINNRRYLFESGDILFENAMRNGNYPSVAMIDIDDFKWINDTFGHETGDMVIKGIADIFLSSLRKSDIVSRYGGEEFCIVANNMAEEEIFRIFESIRTKIHDQKFSKGDESFTVSVSIGICTKPQASFTAMVNKADEMMYAAKKNGKNQVILDSMPDV